MKDSSPELVVVVVAEMSLRKNSFSPNNLVRSYQSKRNGCKSFAVDVSQLLSIRLLVYYKELKKHPCACMSLIFHNQGGRWFNTNQAGK